MEMQVQSRGRWRVRSCAEMMPTSHVTRHTSHVTLIQNMSADADVQRLKQRRQNLMYQVAVLQLQRVRAAAPAALHNPSTTCAAARTTAAHQHIPNLLSSQFVTESAGENGFNAANAVM